MSNDKFDINNCKNKNNYKLINVLKVLYFFIPF